MKKFRVAINVLAILVLTVTAAALVQAQTRTWVSAVGDDLNPCSRTAPCKTFAGALSKTVAGGEINAIDAGGFGAVTINKSITIDGGGTFAALLAGGINGIIINGAGIEVTIRNLSLNGSGTGLNGVRILAASEVSIENCQIFGFGSASGRGVSDERSSGGKLSIKDTIVRNNGSSGIVILPAVGAAPITASLDNVRSEGNGNSGFVASNGSRVTISNSIGANNANTGFVADGPAGGAEMNLENCLASGNAGGVIALGGGTIRFANVHVTNNSVNGVLASGGIFVSYGNNKISGNSGNNILGVAPVALQ